MRPFFIYLKPILYISSLYGITFIPTFETIFFKSLRIFTFFLLNLLNITSFTIGAIDFYNLKYIQFNKAVKTTELVVLATNLTNSLVKIPYYYLMRKRMEDLFKGMDSVKRSIGGKGHSKKALYQLTAQTTFLQLLNFSVENYIFYRLTGQPILSLYMTYWSTIYFGRVEYLILKEVLFEITQRFKRINQELLKLSLGVDNLNKVTTRSKFDDKLNKITVSNMISRINDISSLHWQLTKLLKEVNEIFDLPLILLMGSNVTLIIVSISYFIRGVQAILLEELFFISLTLIAFYWSLMLLTHIIFMIEKWTSVKTEVNIFFKTTNMKCIS